MSHETKCHRHERARSTVSLISGDSLGMNLGELRQAVALAEGMPDKATVLVERLYKHPYEGRYWVRELHLEADAPMPTPEVAP